jgi:hypothetical protein
MATVLILLPDEQVEPLLEAIGVEGILDRFKIWCAVARETTDLDRQDARAPIATVDNE